MSPEVRPYNNGVMENADHTIRPATHVEYSTSQARATLRWIINDDEALAGCELPHDRLRLREALRSVDPDGSEGLLWSIQFARLFRQLCQGERGLPLHIAERALPPLFHALPESKNFQDLRHFVNMEIQDPPDRENPVAHINPLVVQSLKFFLSEGYTRERALFAQLGVIPCPGADVGIGGALATMRKRIRHPSYSLTKKYYLYLAYPNVCGKGIGDVESYTLDAGELVEA